MPLDLFGDVEEADPVSLPREPDIYCRECRTPLIEGLATCARCGVQNEPIPIVTAMPPPSVDPEAHAESSSYAGRVAFAFVYIGRDIARSLARTAASTAHHILEWTISGSDPRKRRK
jgi:hypothetical protein